MLVMRSPMGVVAPFACPPCAYYEDGHCVWCPDGADEIPECTGCENRQRSRPWYSSSEFLVPLTSMILATVVSAVILSRMKLRG